MSAEAADSVWDLAVVGGGVHGAALAWRAANRGLTTLLLERDDFAGGASANSLKIIHGGLRYLQSLDIRRVRESAGEQRWMCRALPHLVAPLECLMPTSGYATRSRAALGLGLLAYAAVTGRRTNVPLPEGAAPAGLVSVQEFQRLVPGLRAPGASGAARWYDAQASDTERLVLALVRAAEHRGASVANYTEVTGLDVDAGRVRGLEVQDRHSGELRHVQARRVADCSGVSPVAPWWQAWVPEAPAPGAMRAVNLVLSRPLAPVAVGFRSVLPDADGRLLFTTPWHGAGIVGTWYFEAPAGDRQAEVQGLLAEVNAAFPGADLALHDVLRWHEGWLPAEGGRLLDRPGFAHLAEQGGPQGLYTVNGVKYTTARAVADQALAFMGCPAGRPGAGHDLLPETPAQGLESLEEELRGRFGNVLAAPVLARLVRMHGAEALPVAQRLAADAGEAALVPGTRDLSVGGVRHIIAGEWVHSLQDLMLRRTGLGSAGPPPAAAAQACLDLLAAERGWDHDRRLSELQSLSACYPPWQATGG